MSQQKQNPSTPSHLKEHTYFVKGMHCSSCEILTEKQIIEIPNVQSVDSSTPKGEVRIEYEGERPSPDKLNQMFKKAGYTFSDQPAKDSKESKGSFLSSFIIAAIIIGAFLLLSKTGVASLLNVNSSSSLIAFFFFGFLASVSSCAALVGGIVLSMSKQWNELYADDKDVNKKFQPHLLFNLGRLVAYGILGGVLGLIGSKLQLSLNFTSFLILAISVLMIFLGLQMLGIKAFQRFQFRAPKFITRYVADEKNFQGKYMPFIMGALTFFLPCGFTITAQGLALLSGSLVTGALIMFIFALGTTPVLMLIGLSSALFNKPHMASRFSKVAGIIVLFFALFNINSQLNILGLNIGFNSNQPPIVTNAPAEDGLPPIVDGKQVLKMNASASGYSPKYFKVRANVPVRWEITDTGTSGCTNAVISKNLFPDEIRLTPGKTSVKEFTPTSVGKYRFSCWMGMVSGTIEVVE